MRPASSGSGSSICTSRRPGRSSAASSISRRLVSASSSSLRLGLPAPRSACRSAAPSKHARNCVAGGVRVKDCVAGGVRAKELYSGAWLSYHTYTTHIPRICHACITPMPRICMHLRDGGVVMLGRAAVELTRREERLRLVQDDHAHLHRVGAAWGSHRGALAGSVTQGCSLGTSG